MNLKWTRIIFLLLFFLSGASSLIYQVVWQRALTLYYGLGFISISIIVSLFLLGLGLGSYFGGKWADNTTKPLKIYIWIELLIGIFGIISPYFIDYIGNYSADLPLSVSWIFILLFFLMPTLLMGATLPFLTKIYIQFNNQFFTTVSQLYFSNTIGASLGAILTSFVLITFFGGLKNALFMASGINFLLAISLYLLAMILNVENSFLSKKINEHVIDKYQDENLNFFQDFLFRNILWIVFVTGFLAIGFEILWNRILVLLIKESSYVFSSILFIYLFGLAIGGIWVSKFKVISISKALNLLSVFQLFIGIYTLLIFCLIFYGLKLFPDDFGEFMKLSFERNAHPPDEPFKISKGSMLFYDIFKFFDLFIWPMVIVLVPSVFMGACFPLVNRVAFERLKSEGRTVGLANFSILIGNVAGGLFTGFVFLLNIKTDSLILLYSVIILFFVIFIQIKNYLKILIILCLIALIFVFPHSGKLIKELHFNNNYYDLKLSEGPEGIVCAKYISFKEEFDLYINGSNHGGYPNKACEILAHLAATHTNHADSVLIVGLGGGVTTSTFLKFDFVKSVELVEINQTLVKNQSNFRFVSEIFANPKFKLYINDVRRFLQLKENRNKKWNVITMDPIRSTFAYSNNIYSAEFFHMVKKSLKPDGIFVMWFDEKKIIPSTVKSVFEYVIISDHHIIASASPITFKWAGKKQITDSLPEQSVLAIKEMKDMKHYINGNTKINSDWRPYSEYYLTRLFMK
jgi:predicted membrane-bound spermidine synthase